MSLSMSSKSFFRGDAGIDLGRLYVAMPQHAADGLYRNARFKGDERGERVASDMVAQVLLYPCQYGQRFMWFLMLG